MSKTVDDLVKVFMQAADDTYAAEYIDPADTTNVAWRAGIAAVVRAVAPDDDEIAAYNRLSYRVQEQLKCECEYLPEDRCIRCSVVDALKCLETRYYEILGDAGEKVAEDQLPHLSERERALFVAALRGDVGPTTPPATDPAPAVCEWTDVGDKYRSACGRSHFAWTSRDGVVVCPHCKAPIKFTEAKP